MFRTEAGKDVQANKITRRVFAAGAGTVLVSFAALKFFESPGVEASGTVHGAPGEVTIVNFSDDGTNLGKQKVAKVIKTDGEWLRQLGKNSFDIAREADTEMPFTGVTWKEHGRGLYRCICCDTSLFSSQTKFESGTGWPSFWAPVAKENVLEKTDATLGMERTEVKCTRCEAHLGHVFPDGPQPTGQRYCMNSASMQFKKA